MNRQAKPWQRGWIPKNGAPVRWAEPPPPPGWRKAGGTRTSVVFHLEVNPLHYGYTLALTGGWRHAWRVSRVGIGWSPWDSANPTPLFKADSLDACLVWATLEREVNDQLLSPRPQSGNVQHPQGAASLLARYRQAYGCAFRDALATGTGATLVVIDEATQRQPDKKGAAP